MADFTNFDVQHDDGIAQITIESESPMNSLNDTLVSELMRLATDCNEDDDVRCLVLRGSDGVFSAGGNISSFEQDQSRCGGSSVAVPRHSTTSSRNCDRVRRRS